MRWAVSDAGCSSNTSSSPVDNGMHAESVVERTRLGQKLVRWRGDGISAYVLATVAVLSILAIRLAFRELFGDSFLLLSFTPAVLVVAMAGGLKTIAFAGALSLLAAISLRWIENPMELRVGELIA
ncbi:PAS domain-containing sensor histidine kinase, partial [Sinorhizobium meliloti]